MVLFVQVLQGKHVEFKILVKQLQLLPYHIAQFHSGSMEAK
jgi:hypothetical protein